MSLRNILIISSFIIAQTSCNYYSNCINVTDLVNVTNSNIITPIFGYIYSAELNCWNTTCNITEAFIPLVD